MRNGVGGAWEDVPWVPGSSSYRHRHLRGAVGELGWVEPQHNCSKSTYDDAISLGGVDQEAGDSLSHKGKLRRVSQVQNTNQGLGRNSVRLDDIESVAVDGEREGGVAGDVDNPETASLRTN